MTPFKVYRGGGCYEEVAPADLLAQFSERRTVSATPFSTDRMALVAGISATLLADRRIIERPALAYFAHWTREAALRDLARRFEESAPAGTIPAPRGVVLHIPPRNVETMFLFSWIVSYLVGNANVVRLPSDQGGAAMEVVDLLTSRLTRLKGSADVFVHYPPDEELNRALSKACDVRLVWGGDAKIKAFETLPLRAGGKALWFGDRYSYAVICGDALTALTPSDQKTLAQKLAVDIFTFDQMGCSSPHKVYVVGDSEKHRPSVVALLQTVQCEARRRGIEIPASHTVRKMTKALALSAEERDAFVPQLSGELVSVFYSRLRRNEDRVGGGFLVVEFVNTLADLIGVVRPSHQTLTHYGFTTAELVCFAKSVTMIGLSRIVPIGQALNFDVVWDGYDLMRELTRTIRVA